MTKKIFLFTLTLFTISAFSEAPVENLRGPNDGSKMEKLYGNPGLNGYPQNILKMTDFVNGKRVICYIVTDINQRQSISCLKFDN